MDVPCIAAKSSPEISYGSLGVGEYPARIWVPGAVISGLMISGATGLGPRDEKIVIEGA